MSERLGRLPDSGRLRARRPVQLLFVATVLVAVFTSPTATAAVDQYFVVARVDANGAGLKSRGVVVSVENVPTPATAINASPDVPRNVAIVIDVGPDQASVLTKEKDLAIALINGLAGAGTSFTIVRAGTSAEMQAMTADRSSAVEHIRDITGDSGERRNVPICNALGLAFRQISLSPGLRVAIFIGEGNDGRSETRYAELRGLAEANHIAFYASLVADHSLRGAKSILRFGWNLQELAGDTAGMFLENQEPVNAARRLSESVRGLCLIAFEMPSRPPGRSKISVFSAPGRRWRAQKAIVIP